MSEIKVIETFETVADWTVFGNDTVNLALNTTRVEGDGSIEFDKVNGAAGLTYAGCYKTLAHGELTCWQPHDKVVWHVYVSALTNVASAFIRIGTSASNYGEWRFADSGMTAGAFSQCSAKLGEFYPGGTGIDLNKFDPTYMAVGVIFDAETDALTDISVDYAYLMRTRPTV